MSIDAISLLSALGHETRLRCVLLLRRHAELCVCELTEATTLAQPHVSRHLGQLRNAGVLQDRRDGLWIHYRIHPDMPDWVRDMLRNLDRGIGDSAPFTEDRTRLAAMSDRPGKSRCA